MTQLIPESGDWVGPPRLILAGQILDGRRRIAELEARGLPTADVPTYDARTVWDAVRELSRARHYERAAQLWRRYGYDWHRSPGALQTALGLTRTDARELSRHLRLSPAERHRKPHRAAPIVARLRRLLEHCEEEGRPATIAELREALDG